MKSNVVAQSYVMRSSQIQAAHPTDCPVMAVSVEFYAHRPPSVFVIGAGDNPCRREYASAMLETIGALADATAENNAQDAH